MAKGDPFPKMPIFQIESSQHRDHPNQHLFNTFADVFAEQSKLKKAAFVAAKRLARAGVGGIMAEAIERS